MWPSWLGRRAGGPEIGSSSLPTPTIINTIMLLEIILLFILIMLSAFFSGTEVALLSITPVRVRTYRNEGRRGSRSLAKLKNQPRRMIITILIGNNVANIVAAALATVVASEYFGSTGLGIMTGVLTLVILIFGEITPKTLASKYAGQLSLKLAPIIYFLSYAFYPMVAFLGWLTGSLERLFKFKKHAEITESEIKSMVEFGVEHNVVAPEEQLIINRALAFADTTAREVMIPIDSTFILTSAMRIEHALPKMLESGFSRVPVYEDEKYKIIGIVLIKDVARELVAKRGHQSLREITVPTTYVPEEMRIDYLFKVFKRTRKHMAMVQDTSKHTIGIVTLEDLLEELVGEIVDESDVQIKEPPTH